MSQVALNLHSQNAKVGLMPTTVSSKATCPISCPLNHSKKGGCYASVGPLNIHWQHVTNGTRGTSYEEFIKQIKSLPKDQIFRHNVAGDLQGDGVNIDAGALVKLVMANKGRRGFTYTHYTNTEKNLKAAKFANDNGFTVNLSANSLSDVDKLIGKGSPVVCVLPFQYQRRYNQRLHEFLETEREYKIRLSLLPMQTKKGNIIIICPATSKDNVTCASCQLCQKAKRSVTIGFPAHGTKWKDADKISKKD